MNKQIYIDLMESVISAYTYEHIKKYTETVITNGIEEHGYPRLTANLGILIAHGRKTEYKDEFRKMMDLCCREIPTAHGKNGFHVGNDFSVKEIVLCLLEIEKAGVFDKTVTDGWRKGLAKINPYQTYSVIASEPDKRINNWAAFGAASEQLRKYAGIGDESSFIENQIKSQLLSFDENGMYRDPNEPMVYDTVTRLQLALTLYFGFDGESRENLEKELLKAADITLDVQSVTGEIPFGGRSNQFLHNEAHFAALCEFYADHFKKCGDFNKAGQFKSAARIALESIACWLKEDKIYHIKNCYSNDSMYGCENYAYFDKYMVTAGSMLYAGYVMADDSIDEVDCPAISKNSVCETSEYFHKVMCRYKDYFVEFDTKADPHYDAGGLGRIHKKGAPSQLCLSMPFAKEPNYGIDIENPSYLSVCAGIKTNDGIEYTCDPETKYELTQKTVDNDFVKVAFECTTVGGKVVNQICTLTDDGVKVEVCGDGEVEILFPLFEFDGLSHTGISILKESAVVSYKGFKCIYSTNGTITDQKSVYANRNGHYKGAAAKGKNSIWLKVKIEG